MFSGTVTSQAERLAKISKAERRSLELEEEMSELHDMVENLSFEKEEIQLEKEIVEQTLVDVRMELAQRDGEIENYKLGKNITVVLFLFLFLFFSLLFVIILFFLCFLLKHPNKSFFLTSSYTKHFLFICTIQNRRYH